MFMLSLADCRGTHFSSECVCKCGYIKGTRREDVKITWSMNASNRPCVVAFTVYSILMVCCVTCARVAPAAGTVSCDASILLSVIGPYQRRGRDSMLAPVESHTS